MDLNPTMTAAEIAATPPLSRPHPLLDRAMQLLLVEGRPLLVPRLADDLGQDRDAVEESVVEFQKMGRLRLDTRDSIIASGGVSVVPADYEVHLAGRRFWAWCAKTGLGVLGALAAGGVLTTRAVDTGERIAVEFDGPDPLPTRCAVLWPTERVQRGCSSAAEELCATYLLFACAADATSWAHTHNLDAEILTVPEATRRSVPRYRHSLGPQSVRESVLL